MATLFHAGSALRFPFVLLLALVLASPAEAQRPRKDQPKNDPALDPYTRGDPEVWKAAGIVSMGGFEFGKTDTVEVDDFMATSDIKWIETAHFELGFALGPYKVTQKEKHKLRAELTRLAEKLPEVSPTTKVLDPWLRTHMFAQRLEEMYEEFLGIIQVDQAVFPDGTAPWNRQGEYQGEGPYLGQKGKYEVLILPSEAASVSFLGQYFGLGIKRTQRWNVTDRESLTVTIHVQQGNLRNDTGLHGHLAFNMAHNFLDGYKHYSYDTPIWLHEGLAHFLERRVSPKYNSFDGAEGSVPQMTSEDDWEGEAKKLVLSGKQPRMAELMRLKGYGEMGLPQHFATWSMVDYLYREKPDGLAKFLSGLKGRTNEAGFPDGSNMPDAHRELFKEHFDMSYAQFDSAWEEWVKANY